MFTWLRVQTMVVQKFLAETSQATMGGFSAEYVNLGPEAGALEAGACLVALNIAYC